MADVKISQLPASTTPLDGTEVLPIVQSATTKQVSIANVTAGRAVSALSMTLTNALPVTSGGTGIATADQGALLSATSANTFSATRTPTLGLAGTAAGTLGLSGLTSGVVTLQTAATAGTWSLTLPTSGGSNGFILTTNGSGVTSWTNPTALGVDLDVGTTAITGGTTTRVLYNNAGVLGEYAVTGTGSVVLGTTPTFTTSALFPAGTVSAPGISVSGDTNTGIYFPAADTLAIATSGTEDMRFTPEGNVSLNSAAFTPATPGTAGNMAMTGTLAMGSSFKRNRIINGDMRIDQRNGGVSVTSDGTNSYTVDRFVGRGVSGKLTFQQTATAPIGFINSLLATSTSAYSIAAGDINAIRHFIEGTNCTDLGFGTANAVTVTLSFWVNCSLTGTFGGALRNSAGTRSYPFSYTISSANTWVLKTITVAGDTTGTWLTTTGIGLEACFGLGVGGTFSSTAGSWAAGNFLSSTGATSVVGTNGATFYVTGVQLEVGSVATPYERQIYSDQVAQCQRYFTSTTPVGSTAISAVGGFWTMIETSEVNRVLAPFMFPVAMRATPTITAFSPTDAATGNWYNRSTGLNVTVSSIGANSFGFTFNTLTNNQTAGNQILVGYTASAEL